ncbi:divalent-cation tolerance protein CutA [Paracraurococcus ruber]|uniref:Divalent-cation tolerance protein CutA n=1 Tax=Paracraurococcus ruber TaxID=77675 RepID=A0ABS1D472_9PROT|nr:divalent-cation tolerance protein CutA [Paracraurococcus ruber]MBK1661647.1 divalent-cation tolerance protein CutA [Paracraurococcus ruber]TDG30663.1 divalent-cation tolerance protein CutA [Paracraurococcus ruber]
MNYDVLWVYATASDAEEARTIARALVREHLAACVNILPAHTAIFRWEGTLQETEEVGFVAKTTAARFDALCARIRALHSYETPAIVALPITQGDPEFLTWVRLQVAPIG